ncbi:MAG TPA: S8/S53 family peptidase [Polyangiaceae bacterium]|nr:S8/S53 family peptidase [Polyangiaceae bacterium]
MTCDSKSTRPTRQNLPLNRGGKLKWRARSALQSGLLFAPCALALSCSDPVDADRRSEAITRGQRAAPTPECGDFTIVAPSSVPLGRAFDASISNLSLQPPRPGEAYRYHWGGEALSVSSASGSSASLACTWSGSHALEVTVSKLDCSTTRTTRVYCSPPLCGDSPATCPGVRVAQEDALACPKSNVLVRVRPGQPCASEMRLNGSAGGAWVEGTLIEARDSNDDLGSSFCSYSWRGLTTQPPVPPASREGVDWQWDCPRIGAHGGSDDMNEALANHGRAALGTIQWKPSPAGEVPVRIAVVDTAAHLWSDPDNNPHGKAVGALALDTACEGVTNCNVQAENFLGLAVYREARPGGGSIVRRDRQHGGWFGGHGDLARAIRAAVDAAPDARTVLNLSIAYEAPELASTLQPAATDFSNRIVLAALHYARCHGALILAAAGNGPVPADPEQTAGFPARWTSLPALSKAECAHRFGVARVGDSPRPLLYAVSGLDFAAQSLLTTRGRGQSAIAALGFAAVRPLPNGSYTRRLTGTSMATATVSGIAASLWSHNGSLSADALVSALYNASPTTAISPDIELSPAGSGDSPFNTVRRITRCSIATAFPALADCVALPTPQAAVPAGTLPTLPAGSAEQTATKPEELRPVRRHAPPWLFPQPPGDPSCGRCSLAFRRLDLAFRSSFPVNSINNMQLLARSGASLGLARVANFANVTSELSSDELIAAAVPSPQVDPFSVILDESFDNASAAELSYQFDVDDITVEATESVLIEQSSGSGGTGPN